MKVLALVLVGLAACVLAQEGGETPPPTDPTPPGADVVATQVQMEEFIARKYLELMLKIQHAQYASQAASSWVRISMIEMKQDGNTGFGAPGMYGSFLEVDRSMEEAYTTWGGDDFSDYAEGDDADQVKMDLMASFQLYSAVKIKFYQTIFRANDLQREFWMDRAAQIALGGAADPQIYQFLYLKLAKTNLETMRLSLALQYISHFTMWLEDAIDVNGVLADTSSEYGEVVAKDQADDLIRDKIWAFTAYNSHAMVDFSVFYIDLYLEYLYAALMGGSIPPTEGAEGAEGAAAAGATGAASLLETESTAQPNQFIPAMAYGYNPMMYMKFYKMYYLWCQMNAAHSGLNSAFAEKMAYDGEIDSDPSNDMDAEKYRTYAQHLFGSFAMNLMHASQLEYLTGIFELYSMFAGGAGSFGSFGNSFGSFGGPQPAPAAAKA